jgi:hypothetical protein
MTPDTPEDTTLCVAITTDPELNEVLLPLKMNTAPPTPSPEVWPALNVTLPPSPTVLRVDPPCTTSAPPLPEFPSPTTMLMAPLEPPVEDPLLTTSQPLLPDTEAPLPSSREPETPRDETFADWMCIEPEPELVLDPLCTMTEPPMVDTREVPADKMMDPPCPELLLPTATLTEPLRPPVASPLLMVSQPLFPEADAPLDNTIRPDAPLDSTSPVETWSDPEPELILVPLETVTEPPRPDPTARESPPEIATAPPTPD